MEILNTKEVVNKIKESVWFFCEGCRTRHCIVIGKWTWNGDLIKPTFTPSVLCTWTTGEEHTPHRCHSFVKDGNIQYLSDCTHKLAGKTLALKPL